MTYPWPGSSIHACLVGFYPVSAVVWKKGKNSTENIIASIVNTLSTKCDINWNVFETVEKWQIEEKNWT